MGKNTTQREFESHAARLNEAAPFTSTLRGLGVDEKSSHKTTQALIDEAAVRINHAIEGRDGEGESLDLRALLTAEMDDILKKVKDNNGRFLSMLDVVTLGLTDTHLIKKFLERHGSDLDDPKDLKYVSDVLKEAIAFFDEIIARETKDKIHPSLKKTNTIDGISHIFQTAAGKHQRQLVPQACGLLRIAAAVDFLERDPLLAVLMEAEEKIRDKHKKHFFSSNGKTYFKTGSPGEVPLEIIAAEQRTKERFRIIAKLLHKPQNNAKEVVDHIGMRVTTKSAVDALSFLYLAFFKPDTAIFPGITIRIGETKQLLLNVDHLMEALRNPERAIVLFKELSEPTVDHSDLTTMGDMDAKSNKYSSKEYRAIHVTFDLALTLKNGKRVHFPIEIQVVDEESKHVNEVRAPHEDYVVAQTSAVHDRLLDNNLLSTFEVTKT